MNNKGSSTIEATLLMPVFICSMVAVYCMLQAELAEINIYEAASETAEYIAESAYLLDDVYMPQSTFYKYIDNEDILRRYVEGGRGGISFSGSRFLEDELVLTVNYELLVSIPFVPKLTKNRSYEIHQRLYKGDVQSGQESEKQIYEYVYVTDNMEAYHLSRGCTHLALSIHISEKTKAGEEGYSACELCDSSSADSVYITDSGNKYHGSRLCSGLKRSVRRVRKDSVGGVAVCTRCGEED